jgi:ATP-dependent helicase/nuclease subunit B
VLARFLLGPAGSGKTFRCLAEINAALKKSPEGAPFIFLAPKQATFQLERQLLADPSLHGYTRLHIFSFERLAQFVVEKLNVAPPNLLSDEGRVMILRALLVRHAGELKLFSKSARRPGFAHELSQLLGELQQHRFTPAKLRALAQRENLRRELSNKLHDLALLHETYSNWLTEHELQDANNFLNFTTDTLRQKTLNSQLSTLNFGGLWLDGFAEMTPQELDLLAAVLPHCENATLAFCLDGSAGNEEFNLGFSIWNVVGKSFQQCRQRIENLPNAKIKIEILPRSSDKNRFAKRPALQHLEQNWVRSDRSPESGERNPENFFRMAVCQNAEAEATFAAREILKFVRATNRFRDCAVLVRNLEKYHKPLAREFRRYGIPFFLDRRESVAHHPLAELTRSTLRTVIFDWQQNDLFAALKAGFCSVAETEIDSLENGALEFGWRGKRWRKPLPDEKFECLRQKILPPFENFAARLAKTNSRPNGLQLAEAFRVLWNDLKVDQQLQNWSDADSTIQRFNDSRNIHATVFEQMNSWLENLELSFPNESLPLRDWLPILEAGLANLTVGVIPPALDQVLIGAIDRSRNPDLKLALVLGVNETIFPATPTSSAILTDADRDELAVSLGPNLRDQISRERFYGYIACTRASEKLLFAFARQDVDGKTLNPSSFIAHLQNIFPAIKIEEFQSEIELVEVENTVELVPALSKNCSSGRESARFENHGRPMSAATAAWKELLELPALKTIAENLRRLSDPNPAENLSPALTEKLYGSTLRTSVSKLEEFAACPFRFFVRSGLRADERKVFELDARERGSFQHDVLKIFHEDLMAEGKRWRDLLPAEARARVGKIAVAQTEHFRDGHFRDSAENIFTARVLAESLQDFVAVIVSWFRGQNEFDPAAAELEFDNKPGVRVPAWEIVLGDGHRLALHGRIDRVDLWRDVASGDTLALVLDYKSSSKKLDRLLVEHGVQLQLLAYLNVLRHWRHPQEVFGVKCLVPAGVFYVNLRGEYQGGGTRAEILADADESRRKAYRHTGRFDAGVLDRLDRIGAADQFNYRRNKDGSLRKGSIEALPRAEFEKLLDGVEAQLRTMGERIFSGAAKVDPYRKGKDIPCEFCDCQAACRIDKRTHPYRVLRAQTADEAD